MIGEGPKSKPLYSGTGGECCGEVKVPISTQGEWLNSLSGAWWVSVSMAESSMDGGVMKLLYMALRSPKFHEE